MFALDFTCNPMDKLDLKLDKSAGPLPRDSSVIVRSRSALGLKYLEVDKGRSAQTYPEGSILPLSAAHQRNDPI